MRLSNFLWILVVVAVLSVLIRFAGIIFIIAARLWYITIPVLIIAGIYSSKRRVKRNKPNNVIDAKFEIIDEDEES